MHPILSKLKERKLVQWALAYLAGAWLVLQLADTLGPRWGLSDALARGLDVALVVGLFITLTLAWYHGEQGRQRVSGMELLIVAILLAFGGGGFRLLSRPASQEPIVSATPSSRGQEPPAVAVLPFENRSPQAEDEFFTDGMHQDVMTHLSGVAGLAVLARSEVNRYRSTPLAIAQVAEELGAQWVVSGSVRRAGDEIRLDVELIDPTTASAVWADSYRRATETADVFSVQAEVARRIVQALEVALTPQEEERFSSFPTESMEAYDLYLQARQVYLRLGEDNNNAAIELYRQALEIDSAYAEAWAGLGDAFARRACCYAYSLDWADSAVAYATRAIDLNPNLAAAHKAYGQGLATQERIREAVAAYTRALELDPSHAEAANNLGLELRNLGELVDGVVWIRRAQRVLPSHPVPWVNLAGAYEELGMPSEAAAANQRVLELDSTRVGPRLHESILWGDREQARILAEEVIRSQRYEPGTVSLAASVAYLAEDPDLAVEGTRATLRRSAAGSGRTDWYFTRSVLGLALVASGNGAQGERILRDAGAYYRSRLDDGAENWRFAWALATGHAALGERDEAIEWLRVAYEHGFRHQRLVELEPSLHSLRADRRFQTWIALLAADVAAMREAVLEEISVETSDR